jgi:glycosyltransferase involved in cell wall biosynthesis
MRALRVLVLHNRYVSALPSGENVVVDQEIDLLRERGHTVESIIRSSDEMQSWSAARRATLPVTALWSREAAQRLSREIAEHRPDVISLHNPYPLLSASVVETAKTLGVPLVQTLHNYRHACMKGTFFRDGAPCRLCLGRRIPTPGVVHGCYRGSRAQSSVMAMAQTVHRRRWQQDVARYFVLTEFMASLMEQQGLPRTRMVIRPQSVADPGPPVPVGRGALYVGRLDSEKGVDLLVQAWQRCAVPSEHDVLTIVGDGELASLVRGQPRVRWLGRQDRAGVQDALRAAALVVIPSRCYEGVPVVAVEALAAGRPLLVTSGGALPEVAADAGRTVEPDAAAMATAMESMLGTADELTRLAGNARAGYLAQHTPEHLGEVLEETFGSLVQAAP